jgi:hypothetical protein
VAAVILQQVRAPARSLAAFTIPTLRTLWGRHYCLCFAMLRIMIGYIGTIWGVFCFFLYAYALPHILPCLSYEYAAGTRNCMTGQLKKRPEHFPPGGWHRGRGSPERCSGEGRERSWMSLTACGYRDRPPGGSPESKRGEGRVGSGS